MRKPRVIIFNDDAMLLELLEFYFDRWGYEVFSYTTLIVCSPAVVKVSPRVPTW